MKDNPSFDSVSIGNDHLKPIVVWSERLATGLDDVDDQHKTLINIINKLGRLHASDTSADELIAVYGELKSYTLYHFQHEEDLMQAWPVNEAAKVAHLKAHQGFVERIETIDKRIVSHPSYVVDHLLAFLVKWLIHHISGVDARMTREIIALRSGEDAPSFDGQSVHPDTLSADQFSDTMSELYDGIGRQSLELLDTNVRLQDEMNRRKKAEDEAQMASQVFYNSSEAMAVTDANNDIIAINPAFTRLTGYSQEEVLGNNPNILSSGRHDEAFYKKMWVAINTTGHWEGELWNRHKNGEVYAESLTINTIFKADGSVGRRVSVFSDITQKKLIEEKLARQAAELLELNGLLSQEIAVKNRLFSVVSHDLRSPFTLLMGLSQQMLRNAGSYSHEKLIEKAATINRVSISVFNAVENLLEWSRAQLDGEILKSTQIPLKEVFEITLDTLGPVAREKGVDIVSKVGDEMIFADPHVVLIILRNLTSNAIKFTNEGDRVELDAHARGKTVEITVSDNGIGIPENLIGELFAIDRKTTTLGTQGEKGTGLGLPLCADLVNKLGGSLSVDSTPGKGARFTVILPVDGIENNQAGTA